MKYSCKKELELHIAKNRLLFYQYKDTVIVDFKSFNEYKDTFMVALSMKMLKP